MWEERLPDDDLVGFTQVAFKFARRLNASTRAVALALDGIAGAALVSRDTFVLMQYLRGGEASRSAYQRCHRLLRDSVIQVEIGERHAKGLKKFLDENQDKIHRIDLVSPSGKQKAILLPWKEFSLLYRFIELHSTSNRISEITRIAASAKFEPIVDIDLLHKIN
jgi:hypothetical protein